MDIEIEIVILVICELACWDTVKCMFLLCKIGKVEIMVGVRARVYLCSKGYTINYATHYHL